jgi:radical SAM superfamily enzyme YgiQ (UPF0313 family)
MDLTLISPFFNNVYGRTQEKALVFPPLNLPIVASLTPDDINVRILDENIEDLDYDQATADLVGITAMTAQATRAYEIADELRTRGSKVVLGGMHPSVMPEEAAGHADAVVVGEAEGVWPEVIDDFRNGKLRQFYRSETRPSLSGLPLARRDLLRQKDYIVDNTIQVVRGCNFRCNFCSVSKVFGERCRFRPLDEVIQEVERLRGDRFRSRFFGFVDDNILANPNGSTELFRRLEPLDIIWAGQAPLSLTDDPETLRLMAESGCKALFVGLESTSPEALRECKKSWLKPQDFKEKIARFHEYGIVIHGAFIFGFDADDESVFERTVEFADSIKIDSAQFAILTPFPGTDLRARLEAEGRIISSNWEEYGLDEVVFRPKRMSPERLQEGYHWAWREFYNLRRIGKRTLAAHRYRPSMIPLLVFQLQYRKLIRHREKIRKRRQNGPKPPTPAEEAPPEPLEMESSAEHHALVR